MSRHYSYIREFSGDLIEVACAVCGSSDSRLLGIDNGFRVTKCTTPDCGLVYVSPRPSGEQLQELYDKYYPENDVAPNAWKHEMDAIVRECRDLLLSLAPTGTVLDIGCSYGHFLQEMVAAGWVGIGVEPSPTAARYAAENSGARIVEGTLESSGEALGSDSFDAVVALYVLEHVSDPRGFLKRVFGVLRDGGLAIIRIPHAEPLMPVNRLLGRSLMEAPMHLNDFSPRNIRRLALDLGFKRVDARVGQLRHSSDVVEHTGALLLGGFGRVLERVSRGRILFRWSGAKTYLLSK
jgi:SAM-dependent methyltransferase